MVQFYKTHKKEMILFLIYLLLVPIFEILNRPIGTIHDLTTVIDDKIPFLIGFFTDLSFVVPVSDLFYYSNHDQRP